MKLGDIITIQKGKKPEVIVEKAIPEYRRLIQIDDLRSGATPKYCPPTTDAVVATPDDIVLAWDGANAGISGFGLSGVIGSTLAILRPSSSILLTPYLGHFLRSQERYLRDCRKGATVPHIDGRVLESLDIPVPPITEQQKIAEIFDRAETLQKQRRTALAQLDTLRDEVLFEILFGAKSSQKDQREVAFESSPIEIIDGDRGPAYPRAEEFTRSGYCLFLTAKNVTAHGFNFSDCQFISEVRDNALGKGKLQLGDVILTTRGTIGNVGLYDKSVQFPHVRINSGMLILRAEQSELRPEYIFIYLQSPHFGRQIERMKSGSAQPQLPIRTLNNMRLLLPSIPMQDRCIRAVRKIESHRTRLLQFANQLDALVASVQHRAFRGEL